jgi:undecaprenyl-diphosphatase
MENILQIFLLSIIQGVTEFIPVSSSAHLNLLSILLEFKEDKLLINISAHIGSLIAVVFFFRKEITQFEKNKKLFLKIILASTPLFLIGYFLVKYDLILSLRTLKIIGWTTLLFGILLYFADKFELNQKIEHNFTIKNAIIIGLFQVLSLVPGVSRSGIIITGARFLKFNRVDAAKISFLLSMPALGGVGLFGIYELVKKNDYLLNINAILTIFLSFIFSYITIKYFLIYLKKFNLNLLIGYRLILGIILLLVAYL